MKNRLSVQRYTHSDSVQFGGKAVKDNDGFLRDSPIVARTGIYIYTNPDGSERREYRPPEEVFSEDSVASFLGKPIVVDHPASGRVDSKSVRKLAVGTILSQGYHKDDNNIGCDIVIHAPEEIGDRRALSLGYRVDLEETPGIDPSGQPYDAIQRNIRVNHLAVVEVARAGMKARLNLDGDEVYPVDESIENGAKNAPKDESEVKTMQVKINSKEYEVEPQVAEYIRLLEAKEENAKVEKDTADKKVTALEDEVEEKKGKLDALKADAENKQESLESMTAERDALKAALDKAEKEKEEAVKAAVEEAKKDVEERKELEDEAEEIGAEKEDGMSALELKCAIIKKVLGDSIKLDWVTSSYIDGAYNAAKGLVKKDGLKAQVKQTKGIANAPKASVKTDSDSAREEMIARFRNASTNDEHRF